MNKIRHGQVAAIALETRMWVEAKAQRSNYNPENLLGWCAIASAELHKRLSDVGITAEIHMWSADSGECHCFCVVDDHVVDVTATQFYKYTNETVVILHQREAEVNEYHTSTYTFTEAAQLRRFQKKEQWPSHQIAYA
jgi:hypothetical protein